MIKHVILFLVFFVGRVSAHWVDFSVPVMQALVSCDTRLMGDVIGTCSAQYAQRGLIAELYHWRQVNNKQVRESLETFLRLVDGAGWQKVLCEPCVLFPAYVGLLDGLYRVHRRSERVQSPALKKAIERVGELLSTEANVPVRPWKALCDEIIELLAPEVDHAEAQAFVDTLRSLRESTWPSVIGWNLSYHKQFIATELAAAGITVKFDLNALWGRLAASIAATET